MKEMSCLVRNLFLPNLTVPDYLTIYYLRKAAKSRRKEQTFFIRKKTAKTTLTTSALNHSSGNGDAVAKLVAFL